MSCDLEKLFRSLDQEMLSRLDAESEFVFSAQNLPLSPLELSTDRLTLGIGNKGYGDHLVDIVHFHAEPETYRYLAMLILSKLFHPKPEEITLTVDSSRIKKLIFDFSVNDPCTVSGYQIRPEKLTYYPEEAKRFPLEGWGYAVDDLPRLSLRIENASVCSRDDLVRRNMAVGFGNHLGNLIFAQLLLNFGSPRNRATKEISLEGECGVRGVGPASAEIDLWLPGGLGFKTFA